ncbi:MAG: UDP-N-acetylglucosamine--N-acetylmuramyl-(pentapeptide) pyrophosphoryl-undecaprenol N-acetylglucosamine transferase [Gammaproteobacteria bacterium]|jgi:UDP-N-acetylglucosamine--N-acetylmuramyl-(pentapeptide) pyrophosphoryl-undecaprenol N-acetylglucosamine transferase
MTKNLTICLTGGGTTGHVSPHFALLPLLISHNHDVFYIGSSGIESTLVPLRGIPFYTIPVGKLRRYLSVKNLVDIFRIAGGTLCAFRLLLQHRPNIVFSKGGFVSVPVAIAAWFLRIPVLSHESDMSPGLATKIVSKFAKKILYTFPETGKYLSAKAEHVGTPIRKELFLGDAEAAKKLCSFGSETRPTLLVMGGSQGAGKINTVLEQCLPKLVEEFNIIHLTGAGKAIEFRHHCYCGFEYIDNAMNDLLALADIVISRAGANSIFELLALRKPMLLIPLVVGSRGDQILNAESFSKQGWANVVDETRLTPELLQESLRELQTNAAEMVSKQSVFSQSGTTERIVKIIEDIGCQ